MQAYPWLKKYPEGIVWDQSFTPEPVHKILEDSSTSHPDHFHLDFFGRRFTYCESQNIVNRLVRGLQDMGLEKGDRVGIFMPNCPQFVWAFFAILKAGGVVVNLSPLYSKPELLHQLKDSGARFVFVLNLKDMVEKAVAVLSDSNVQSLIISDMTAYMGTWSRLKVRLFLRNKMTSIESGKKTVSFEDVLNNNGNPKPIEIHPENDLAVLQYTGGTTGLPKGAMLSHANLSINIKQAMSWDPTMVPGEGKALGVLPFFHVYAMTVIMCTVTSLGGEIVVMMRFDADKVLDAIVRKKITMLPAVPTMYSAFLHSPKFRKTDFSCIKSAFSAGAPLPAEVKTSFDKCLTGDGIREGYGLTETSPIALANPTIGLQKINSVGLPVPATKVIFTDPDNPHRVLDYGETGEICIEGPQVMKGYWQNNEATSATIIDGRLHTGDIGYMDEDGYTFIVDRKKDLILVSGFNVYPRVIEDALYTHDSVKEATVIGVPDGYHGEVPKAFVVLRDGADVTAKELTTYLRERIGRHEIPKEIEFRKNLPRTMVGKLSKKELVEEEKSKRSA